MKSPLAVDLTLYTYYSFPCLPFCISESSHDVMQSGCNTPDMQGTHVIMKSSSSIYQVSVPVSISFVMDSQTISYTNA